MEEQKIPSAVQKRLDGWFTTFWAFTICHYLFGIGGVLASTIVAASSDTHTQKIAGIISAVCIAIVGFVQPDQKYRKFVIAWRLLDEKVNKYRYNLISVGDLVDGMALAEKTLDQLERETSRHQGGQNQQTDTDKQDEQNKKTGQNQHAAN